MSNQKEISDIMSKAKSCQKTELFTKISKLISYLQQLKGMETENCIEISIDHKFKKENQEPIEELDGDNDEQRKKVCSSHFQKVRIQLQSMATEIVYINKLFE